MGKNIKLNHIIKLTKQNIDIYIKQIIDTITIIHNHKLFLKI